VQQQGILKVTIYKSVAEGNGAAAELLAGWLKGAKNFMPAAGNTPLELYRLVAGMGLEFGHLNVFLLDEYVGVPTSEPRNCANLLRRSVQQSWGIPDGQFHAVSSEESEALASVLEHERKIEAAGGLDVVVLGLGQNGHLGFNEPGSAEDSGARIVPLEPISVEANGKWFEGKYAPDKGVTVGLKTILAARKILIMAFGPHKTAAVRAMVKGPRTERCPASLLQGHQDVRLVVDEEAAVGLNEN
jgi:glucosamine-6-phosphate deaminase